MSIIHRLEYAVGEICKEIMASVEVVDWQTCEESYLWHELVACILGSQVQYEHSRAAMQQLVIHGALEITHLKNDIELFERNIVNILERPVLPPFNKNGGRKYRYPKAKAKQIRRTAEQIYLSSTSVTSILRDSNSEIDARLKLVYFAAGIGPKQASLFLRNVGFAKNLAILDTHILRYMTIIGLLPDLISSIPTLRKYETIEKVLSSYSERFQGNLAAIDAAIWVVMRTCRKENLLVWA